MFKGFYNLTSAMLTDGRKLDVISNNMTNVATPGYKVDRFTASTFQEMVWSRVGNMDREYTELGTESFITAPSRLYTDYTQASFDETGLPLNFGIEGNGYFAIETEDGNRIYTRDGSFALDNDGYLVLPGQGFVLDTSGESISLVTDQIDTDGYGGMYTSTGGFLGRIGVYTFEEGTELEKNDQGYFVTDAEATAETVTVHQRMVERSNVDLTQQMVDMISTQRAFQSAAEVMKIYDNLINSATSDVGRLV